MAKVYVINKAVLPCAGIFSYKIVEPAEARLLLSNGFESYVSMAETARILSVILGIEVNTNTDGNFFLAPNDKAIVFRLVNVQLPQDIRKAWPKTTISCKAWELGLLERQS